MNKKWIYALILIGFIILAGCDQTSSPPVSPEDQPKTNNDSTNEDNINKNNDDSEDDTSFQQLDEEEAYKIVRSTLLKFSSTISKLQKRHLNWFIISGENAEKETYTEEFLEASAALQQALKPLLTDEALDTFGDGFLITYFCECDAYFTWSVYDLKAQFMVTEQTADTFVATSITLGNELYNEGFTSEWHFKKDKGQWKLDDYVYVSTDEELLALTFEDIDAAFFDDEAKQSTITFVDEVERDGSSFIVIKTDHDYIQAYDTETGALNHDIMLDYMESEE